MYVRIKGTIGHLFIGIKYGIHLPLSSVVSGADIPGVGPELAFFPPFLLFLSLSLSIFLCTNSIFI